MPKMDGFALAEQIQKQSNRLHAGDDAHIRRSPWGTARAVARWEFPLTL